MASGVGPRSATGVLLRALLLVTAAVAGATGLVALLRGAMAHLSAQRDRALGWSGVPLDAMLEALAAVALSGCGLWLLAITVDAAFEAVTGASSAALRAVSPPVIRRVVLVFCGIAVGSSLLPPATAAEDSGLAGSTSTPEPAVSVLAGLPLPDRAVGEAPASAEERRATQRSSRASASAGSGDAHSSGPEAAGRAGAHAELLSVAVVETVDGKYLVRPGDSLWSIAERLLDGAGPRQIDAKWRQIHRANRSVIGPDPDLIIPGTTLRIPRPSTDLPHDHHRPGQLGDSHRRKDAS